MVIVGRENRPYITQSPGSKWTEDDMYSWVPLISIQKSKGPIALPWGTSEATAHEGDLGLLIMVYRVRLVESSGKHSAIAGSILNSLSLHIRSRWATLSNALEKSREMALVWMFVLKPAWMSRRSVVSWVSQAIAFRNLCLCITRRLWTSK